MNKSECILLCISEYYYENSICENEARYALQTGKTIFFLKIRNDPLFGFEHHFNIFIILQSKKSSGHQKDEIQRMLTVEERRKKWLRKPTNCTKQNLLPFSPIGDINDAIFPRPEYILEELGLNDQSLLSTQSSSIKIGNIFECIYYETTNRTIIITYYTFGIRTEKRENLLQIFSESSSRISNDVRNQSRLPCLPLEIMIDRKDQVFKRHDANNYKKRQTYKRPTREELKVYFKKFAQQMNENTIEFEKFFHHNQPNKQDHILHSSHDVQHDNPTENCSPGPAAYNIDYTTKAVYPSSPHYSLSSRLRDPCSYSQTPGPGSYYATRLEHYKSQAPMYSFGKRHSMKKALCIVKYED
ncbi:hypothetical protein I4U23_027482 [Adineta vaga]|nr:hypothetical protein I4U23_027482 [Adineta vaga]